MPTCSQCLKQYFLGLPRKTESEGDLNLGGKQIHTKSVITYYDYEADIKIDKPL